jgi:hypothetical protein
VTSAVVWSLSAAAIWRELDGTAAPFPMSKIKTKLTNFKFTFSYYKQSNVN